MDDRWSVSGRFVKLPCMLGLETCCATERFCFSGPSKHVCSRFLSTTPSCFLLDHSFSHILNQILVFTLHAKTLLLCSSLPYFGLPISALSWFPGFARSLCVAVLGFAFLFAECGANSDVHSHAKALLLCSILALIRFEQALKSSLLLYGFVAFLSPILIILVFGLLLDPVPR